MEPCSSLGKEDRTKRLVPKAREVLLPNASTLQEPHRQRIGAAGGASPYDTYRTGGGALHRKREHHWTAPKPELLPSFACSSFLFLLVGVNRLCRSPMVVVCCSPFIILLARSALQYERATVVYIKGCWRSFGEECSVRMHSTRKFL
ncbi:unnamed protein product [Calypogeia fissa]